jgi:hypothetical protein
MRAVLMPWNSEKEVPHITLEVNQACNLKCKGCYKDKQSFQKPVDKLKEEIDLAIANRELETITILGGEPTLHPELPEIIKHIASKNIRSFMLTNGSLLTPELLQNLKKAGLNRVGLHIDKHQMERPDIENFETEYDLNPLREKYVNMVKAAGLETGLVITLYQDTIKDLPMLETFCHTHDVNRFLITTYSQTLNADESPEDNLSSNVNDVYAFFNRHSGTYPSYYLPSTKYPSVFRWLIYTKGVTKDADGTIRTLPFDPKHEFALSSLIKLTRLSNGKHRFESTATYPQRYIGLILYALLSLSPTTILATLFFLITAYRNKNLDLFAMVFQEPPQQKIHGEYDPCLFCPDATVRNGKIVPVCLADHEEPLKFSDWLSTDTQEQDEQNK